MILAINVEYLLEKRSRKIWMGGHYNDKLTNTELSKIVSSLVTFSPAFKTLLILSF